MANKYNLPYDTKYKVISSNYLSLENGGGTQCDNCNKIITTTVQVEDTEGNSFIVGTDCAITLAGIGVFDEKNIKDTVKRCKKFYTAIKNDSRLLIKESKDSYALFAVVDKSYDGKPIKPFIHVPFIGIAKENLSEKFKHLIRTISWIEETYPELKDCYYLTKWKEENDYKYKW